jgi:Cdc6-like AAA superfamily ATPase
MANAHDTLDNTTFSIANEIWSALSDAAVVEAPLSMKPFYDKVLQNEDKTDYMKPSELLLDEYQAVVPKTNWNFNIKYSLFSINMAAADKPIRLCHLLLYVAYK